MFVLPHFTLSDMTRCGIELRRIGAGAASMEEVADRTVRFLHRELRMANGEGHACALARLFVTLPYAALQDEQQEAVRGVLGGTPETPTLKCLTLLGSAGDEQAWCSRRSSHAHKALPLASEESIARSPMIAQLIRQLGVETATLLTPDPALVLDAQQHTFNVFHVPEAAGSPYIPAQREFVIPYGIRSVLGFGGLLPSGELYATILFSRAPIPREVADLFRTLALNVKVAILPHVNGRVFS